ARRSSARSAHPEVRQPARLLVFDVYAADVGARRALVTPRHDRLDGVSRPLEPRLDSAVAAVAHPAGDAALGGVVAGGVAEPDALDAAVDGDVAGDRVVGHSRMHTPCGAPRGLLVAG